jgi:hydroxymethylpyrimidine/phosphomethylpyrimidine kinase
MNNQERPYVLSVAGFDPSAGAGVLADVKTFEQNSVYGLAVVSGVTLQTESQFISVRWTDPDELLSHLKKMLVHYPIVAVKTGIMPSLKVLDAVLTLVRELKPSAKVVVDPVIKSTTGFGFLTAFDREHLSSILKKATLLTPNFDEALKLSGMESADDAGKYLSKNCAVLLKGGHNETEPGTDYLYDNGSKLKLLAGESNVYPKHGSGCVLSSAIAAQLALGKDLATACKLGKEYVEKFLCRNENLLGYHA